MNNFSNLFTEGFTDSQKKLFHEVVGKAAIFEWQIKLFLLILPDYLYVKSLVQKTKTVSLKLRYTNGNFRNLNELIKLMFKHFPFSKTEQSRIEYARECRNKLVHYNLRELLDSLDLNQDLFIIGRGQQYKKNKIPIISELNAFNIMITRKKFVRRLHTIFEQAIRPIDKKIAKLNSEISRLGKIADKRNLVPKK